MRMIRSSGKFMPEKLLNLWLRRCASDFEDSTKLAIWEFLFLLANTQDRPKAIKEKLPNTRMKLEKDSNKITYKLDTGLSHNRSPDLWLQKIYNSQIDVKRVHFTADKRKKVTEEIKQENKKKVKIARKSSSHLELRNMLRNPDLFREIKETLAEAKTLLKKSKTGSQKTLPKASAEDGFGGEFYMPPGQWTQVKYRKRPLTATTTYKSRPKTADTDFFHLTSGADLSATEGRSNYYSTRPKLDRPLTAGTHRSTTRTGMEIPIKTEPFKPLNLRQATVLGLMRAYSIKS
mmetsp:Transcript_3102/g.6432  ORF Transcript_3102/g.6432 Transcript_3102/m.6432 type:complete len:290 (+) Transcript_3102:399-1268(+)